LRIYNGYQLVQDIRKQSQKRKGTGSTGYFGRQAVLGIDNG